MVNRRDLHRLLLSILVILSWTHIVPAQTRPKADLGELRESATKLAAQKVARSVVQIQAVGGAEKVGGKLIGESGLTTGLIVDPEGYLVSSAFAFAQNPTSILVRLPGGERALAKIVARDQSRMMVLLKVDIDSPLPVATIRDADSVRVGQWAIAVGKTFDAEKPNLSLGIVSAVQRNWGRAIQADCKISALNYGGPLIDIRGQVMGLIVPMSPQDSSAVAGTEWYDSGIGFAVPIEDVMRAVSRMKTGEDLYRGLLGITLKGSNVRVDPAEIATAPAGSPARLAGLQKGDVIIAAAGREVSTQAHLKAALGPLYAGEQVNVTVQRGDEVINAAVELVATVPPFELPYLGLLLDRSTGDGPATIHYVFPDTPAAGLGLKSGDQLLAWDGQPVASRSDWHVTIASAEKGEDHSLTWQGNGDEPKTEPLRLSTITARETLSLPPLLPADKNNQNEVETNGKDEESAKNEEPPARLKSLPLKLPTEPQTMTVFAPENYDAETPHGLVVWLGDAGEVDADMIQSRWAKEAARDHLIILAPQSRAPNRWVVEEIEVIRQAIESLQQTYSIDQDRRVLYGYRGGGALALRLGLLHRNLVRGIAVVDAAIPRNAVVRGNDPVERLFFWWSFNEVSDTTKRTEADIDQLRKMRFPVTTVPRSSDGPPSGQDFESLVRWIDGLDRI